MVGSLPTCCARAASGHAAAAPASSVIKWRRRRSSMGALPEPAGPAYPRLRVPRKRLQVLGVDLNRSELSRWRETAGHPAFALRNLWNIAPGLPGHSGLMPADFTTLPTSRY